MKEIIKKINKKYFLNIGNEKLSPILSLTAAEMLSYCENFNNLKKLPYLFSFPLKKDSALWLSVQLLVNYFYEDYINSGNRTLHVYKKGDYIELFGCVVQYYGENSKSNVLFYFADNLTSSFKESILKYSKLTNKRKLCKYKKFCITANKYIYEGDLISKLIIPDEAGVINEGIIKSKVLLISGLGNKRDFIKKLKNKCIFDEPLSNAFNENNLIITPTCEKYKNIFDPSYDEKYSDFLQLLNEIASIVNIEEVKKALNDLLNQINLGCEINDKMDNEFKIIFENYLDEVPELVMLEKSYPGIKEVLPSNLKAVVINDINQFQKYPNTVMGFINCGIPVFLICDRDIRNSEQHKILGSIIEDKNSYRVNWQSETINRINTNIGLNIRYIDDDFWKTCKRFSKQKIIIKVFPGNDLDTFFPILRKLVSNMDYSEKLKKSFYEFLNPAFYLIKNSENNNEHISYLVRKFCQEYESVKKYLNNSEVDDNVKKIIDCFNEISENTKIFYDYETYSNRIICGDEEIGFIPSHRQEVNLPADNKNKMLFTGFPYHEFQGKYLHDAVFKFIIPKIWVYCWPVEASLTRGYLKKRINYSQFEDRLPSITIVGDNNYKDIKMQKKQRIVIEGECSNRVTPKEDDFKIESYRYYKYNVGDNYNTNSKVKCDILNFSDNSFMFLPKGSKVLSEVETENGKMKMKNVTFKELNNYSRVFIYKKDRGAYREISKHDSSINKAFNSLNYWKNNLFKLFIESELSIEKLESKLFECKKIYNINEGNPTKNNIRRWLFDDEIIMPDINNMKIIIYASKEEDPEDIIKELDLNYRSALSYTISLSSQIKKYIQKKIRLLENYQGEVLKVSVNGVEIQVQIKQIVELSSVNEEIDYKNTRRILW